MSDAMAQAIEDAVAKAEESSKESQKEETKEEVTESEETSQEEVHEEPVTESNEEPKEKKDRTYQGKINFLTKQLRQAEERAKLAEAQAQQQKQPEPLKVESEDGIEQEFENVDDFLKYVKSNFVPKDQLQQEFQRLLEKQAQEDMSKRFQSEQDNVTHRLMDEYHDKWNESVGAYDDETESEMRSVSQIYLSNPAFFKAQMQKMGFGETKNGQFVPSFRKYADHILGRTVKSKPKLTSDKVERVSIEQGSERIKTETIKPKSIEDALNQAIKSMEMRK